MVSKTHQNMSPLGGTFGPANNSIFSNFLGLLAVIERIHTLSVFTVNPKLDNYLFSYFFSVGK